MRKLFFLCLIVLVSGLAKAQDRVKWEFTYNSTTNEIEMKASIADGWHLYSQHIRNNIGPVPTSFTFDSLPVIQWQNDMLEPTPIHEYDENFEATLDFFKNTVTFTRKLPKGFHGEIKGYVTYMACNDIMCLPPSDINFTILVP
jgi:Disulphide bond corrector protein DsbC